jgi:hypothetical protein
MSRPRAWYSWWAHTYASDIEHCHPTTEYGGYEVMSNVSVCNQVGSVLVHPRSSGNLCPRCVNWMTLRIYEGTIVDPRDDSAPP